MVLHLNGISYKVNDDEYTKFHHHEYNFLKLHNELALHERILGLIRKIIQECKSETHFISFNTQYGGFIPINLSKNITSAYLLNTAPEHIKNIEHNLESYEISNVFFDKVCLYSESNLYFFFADKLDQIIYSNLTKWVVIATELSVIPNARTYKFGDTGYYIYISNALFIIFEQVFCYWIENTDTDVKMLDFDNLIHLCIMVKNAGPQFEQMLTDNLPFIDEWTILDTGSTDETLDIIQRVLVGKKSGTLYQEPFINFRDSRNRLLDLAGTSCKYTVMLDDTYVLRGNLREFLKEVRSDQYATSYSLYIHSDDTKYGSNRIVKSDSGLRYIHKIHEVITDKDNVNVFVPENRCYIDDRRFDYMKKRTMERKQLDLKLLFEELEENPNDPRAYYYLAQTYKLLENYEKAFYYFMKRCEYINVGFLQERADAAFEAARIANFKLNKPWKECEELYNHSFKMDESRPESQYFIGIHYYLEGNMERAYDHFKQGFEIGFPIHCQYSLKPTLSFHFLPKFLAKICYSIGHRAYDVGLAASKLFLENNAPNAEDYAEIVSWYKIYEKLTFYKGSRKPTIPSKPILCFVADGGFHPWSGSNILTTGVGGSETYIIEMARYIQQDGFFNVFVFCKTPDQKDEIFEGVVYKHLDNYYEFINTTYVHTSIISRFSEYLPLTYKGYSENVYMVLHDLTPSGIVIPVDPKLKRIFCLTEWHVDYFTGIFPQLKNKTVPFYYGVDEQRFTDISVKQPYKFIYSSFPNRGLLELLIMWPRIIEMIPNATLHIYSDVNHKWSNDVEPEKMAKIKQLLSINMMGIYYHGWVSKTELSNAWKTSSVWLYPCTFMETFCLTALEAAKSKTLVITNHLAALQNTVGDRGVIIPGDPTTQQWQDIAIQSIYDIYVKNIVNTDELLRRNNEWASTLTWKNQANKLLNLYILPQMYEYKNMHNWTNDLPTGSKQIFLDIIQYFNTNCAKKNKPIRVLEIGTYSGMSLIEIIRLIPNSTGIGIDIWSNYNENGNTIYVDELNVYESAVNNVKRADLENRIVFIKGMSSKVLSDMVKGSEQFDFIYVDGSHLCLDCYGDLLLSWNLLEKGGVMAIDDYTFNQSKVLESPYDGVNHFLKNYEGEYTLLSKGYRVFIQSNT
jgi:predicted O-methyltransferase YrrM